MRMRAIVMAAAAVVGAVVGLAFAAVLATVLGIRWRTAVVISTVRRLSRATQSLALKNAGRRGAYASVVMHTGRISGRHYRTPVRAVVVDGRYIVALPYSSTSDWVRNVLTAGNATVVHEGRTYRLDLPRLVSLDEVDSYFPARERRAHRMLSVSEALLARATPTDAGDGPERFPAREASRSPARLDAGQ